MKTNWGRLGIELYLSWNDADTPVTVTAAQPSKPTVAPAVPLVPTASVSDIRSVVYKITSAFEGGPIGKINYENLTGNFDGQGLSIGFLQWCVGQGSDIQLFKKVEADYPGVLKTALGQALYAEFIANLDKPLAQRLHWAQTAINDVHNRIEPNWKLALLTLCRTQEFKTIQNHFAEKVFQHALSICKEYGLKTNRAVMLAFDICTQNGSIKQSTKDVILSTKSAKERALGRQLTEKEYLEIIAIKRAEASNPLWVNDVKSRKLAIVYGHGTVHGDKYDLDHLGLNDDLYVA